MYLNTVYIHLIYYYISYSFSLVPYLFVMTELSFLVLKQISNFMKCIVLLRIYSLVHQPIITIVYKIIAMQITHNNWHSFSLIQTDFKYNVYNTTFDLIHVKKYIILQYTYNTVERTMLEKKIQHRTSQHTEFSPLNNIQHKITLVVSGICRHLLTNLKQLLQQMLNNKLQNLTYKRFRLTTENMFMHHCTCFIGRQQNFSTIQSFCFSYTGPQNDLYFIIVICELQLYQKIRKTWYNYKPLL